MANPFGPVRYRLTAAASILAAIAVYAALLLWPYNWSGASFGNGAEPIPDGGIRFPSPGIAVAKDPTDWVTAAVRSGEMDLSLRFRSAIVDQTGPARLLTLSKDILERNLTIGQDGPDLVLRFRLPGTDKNGLIDKQSFLQIPDVFPTAGWVDLRISILPGALRIAKDGETLLEERLAAKALESWDPSYKLALGNELTLDRPWIGEIQTAIIRTGDVAIDYAAPEALRFPKAIVVTTKPPKLTPLKDLNPKDAALNTLLFAPFGLLLGLLINTAGGSTPRWLSAFGAVLLVAAVSAAFEALQILVPRRAPSVDDLIFNVIGGALGILAAMTRDLKYPQKPSN
ncbi:MAG: VanZ family protein [Geminicoccaceae bacterium]